MVSNYDGLTADTAVRPACLSVTQHGLLTLQFLNLSSHTAVLRLPPERPHVAQGEDGLQM
jgi:hypothetical protein